MKYIYKTIILAVSALSLAACNLDKFPTTSIVLDETKPLIQTATDLETYRWSNYAYFRGYFGGSIDIADDLMCDGFNATQGYGNNYGGVHRADQSFTSGDEYVEGFWGNSYSAIRNYNLLIAEVEKNTDPALTEGVRAIAGEAYFFRAFTYLKLARRFGKYYDPATAETELCVPIVLKYDQSERPARSTVQQVYDCIKQDIDSAEVTLSSINGAAASPVLTKDVLQALKANYYLDIRDYKNAFEAAESLIKSGTYSLCSTEAEFKAMCFEDGGDATKGSLNHEAIMQIFVSKTELPNGYGSYTGYTEDPNSPTGFAWKPLYLPSKTLIDSYNPADFRYRNWFDNCKVTPFGYAGLYHNEKFSVFVRYKGNIALTSSGDPDGHVAPVPYSIAEMYLIAAEAAVKGGSSALNALVYLKALQEARKSNVSPSASLEAIQKEWFKETVGEGKRIECLKRWGLGCPARTAQAGALAAEVLMTGAVYDERVLSADDYHFVWPIPSYEMKVNSNLVQNPGYGATEVE